MSMEFKANNSNIYNITAASIEKYLVLKEWQREYAFKNKNLMVFDSKIYKSRIAIPASESYNDFIPRLMDILRTIASFENRSEKEIIKEILSSYYNTLEFRIVSKMSANGKLPLGYAVECMEGLRELILYPACAEENPQPICWRATNRSKDILENFELGQTEKGSFVINIDTKVADERAEQVMFDECTIKPFEYDVVERVHIAFEQINSVVENNLSISKMTETAYEKGITANMCEALLKLKPEHGEVEVYATIRYASVITKEVGKKDCIKMINNHFFVMNEISKTYRDRTLYKNVILNGLIKSLGKKETSNIIHLYAQYDGKYRMVKIVLSDRDYRNACNVHRDGLEVEVVGELDMSKKNWELTKITSFKWHDKI